MKEYADKRSRAKESSIEVGDSVLVRQSKENKLSTKFIPNPYRVIKMKGTRVNVERNGRFYLSCDLILGYTRHYKHLFLLICVVYEIFFL